MSDASEHVLPTVEDTIDGNKITFGKLSVTDRGRILRKVRATAIEEHDKATQVLPPEQQYIQRRDFNAQVWGAGAWIRHVNSSDGQEEIFRASLAKANPKEKVDALLDLMTGSASDTTRLLCQVTGLPYTESAPVVPTMKQVGMMDGKPIYMIDEAAAPAQGAEPNPTEAGKPKAYGQP
jgi:hypothetical protein